MHDSDGAAGGAGLITGAVMILFVISWTVFFTGLLRILMEFQIY